MHEDRRAYGGGDCRGGGRRDKSWSFTHLVVDPVMVRKAAPVFWRGRWVMMRVELLPCASREREYSGSGSVSGRGSDYRGTFAAAAFGSVSWGVGETITGGHAPGDQIVDCSLTRERYPGYSDAHRRTEHAWDRLRVRRGDRRATARGHSSSTRS